MEQLRLNAKLFFTVLYISQVCGTPTFFLAQPDCYQQYGEDPYESYQSYQGPSYQETLQAMVQETIRAISEIVQITATATKQEFAAFSNIFFQNAPVEDCNKPDPGNTPGDYQFNQPPMVFPGQPMDNFKPVEPQTESEDKIQNITFTTETEIPQSTASTPTTSKPTGIGNSTSTTSPQMGGPGENQNSNMTTETTTISNSVETAPSIDIRGGVDQPTTSPPTHPDTQPNVTDPAGHPTIENVTSTQPSPSGNAHPSNTTSVEYSTLSHDSNMSTVSPLAGELTTLWFTTDQITTETATEISTTESSTLKELTTLSLNTTPTEVTKQTNRKPKL